MNKKSDIDDLMFELHRNARYWHRLKDKSELEKIEGAIFSMLCILDGVSGSFNGDISTIERKSRGMMLHEQFFKNQSSEGDRSISTPATSSMTSSTNSSESESSSKE